MQKPEPESELLHYQRLALKLTHDGMKLKDRDPKRRELEQQLRNVLIYISQLEKEQEDS